MGTLLWALIIEGSCDDAALLRQELHRGGYDVIAERVETAASFEAALEHMRWDVVLTGDTVPHLSAPDALAILKSRQIDIPFIVVSGTIGEETAVNAMKAGDTERMTQGKPARLLPTMDRELREPQVRQERREVEEALRQSEERFRQIVETIDEGYWMADSDLNGMIYISPGYESLWGLSRASLYENPRAFHDSIHPDDREQVLLDLESSREGRPFDHVFRIMCPDGGMRWVWDRGFPIRNEAGSVVRFAGVAVDITERASLLINRARNQPIWKPSFLGRVEADRGNNSREVR